MKNKNQNFKIAWLTFMLLCVFGSMTYAQVSEIIYKDGNGNLNYVSDAEDNRIPDFSFAGYKSGEEAIPNVPVQVTISPIAGDNRAHIQAAINQVSALPLVNGVRGAVLLQAGTYSVSGSIYIRDSGVVLRGSGNGSDPATNTIIYNPERSGPSDNSTSIIRIEGPATSDRYTTNDDILPGTTSTVTNDFLPVNSRSFEVDNTSLYAVDDIIIVYRKPESPWFQMIDNGGAVNDPPWTTATGTGLIMVYPRKITAINGNTLIIDQPIYEHIFGNGVTTTTIYKLNTANRFISNVGLENIRITAGYNPANLNNEFSARDCVRMDGLWDSWATDVVTENFWFAGFTMRTTNRITIDRCEALDPISLIDGGHRYNFNMDYGANNILVKNCVATEARHAYVSNGTSQTSGIVFLKSTSDGGYNASEGHRLWTQALLYDQMTFTNSNVTTLIGLYNRGDFGTSHGWSSAHSVAWNSTSKDYSGTNFIIQKPPTAQNYGMFCDATVIGTFRWPGDPGYIEGTRQTAPFPSLYEEQLADRLANGVLPDPPAKVKAIDDNGDLTISWLDNSGEEDSYVIEISTDNGTTYQVFTTLAANTEQYVTPMSNATYDFSTATFQIYSTKGANKSSRRIFSIEDGDPIVTVTTNYSVIEDAHTTSGTNADTNYGGLEFVQVKTSPGIGNSTRSGYLKFDLSAVTDVNAVTEVLLNFEVYYSFDALDFNIYQVSNDTWSESTVTYNTAPNSNNWASTDIVGSFSTSPATTGTYTIDVTDYVKASLLAADTTISLGFYDDNDENGHIYFRTKEYQSGQLAASLDVGINQALSINDFDLNDAKNIVRQYPNPIYGNNAFFEFNLKSSSDFNLSIFDINGRLVKSVKKELYPGNQKIEVDTNLKNGLYIYQIITDEFTRSGKVIVSRR